MSHLNAVPADAPLSCRGPHVTLTYMSRRDSGAVEEAKNRLVEAERAYQSARTSEHVARGVRDDAIVEAHRLGLSSRAIGELIGGMDQANVVRARRRATSRQEVVPGGLLSPADAVRRSGLTPEAFVTAVRQGRIEPVAVKGQVRAFRPEDVDQLQRSA